MKSLITLISLALLLVSCKTTEDIQREQMIDNLSMQMVQTQKLTAETSIKLQSLEDRINQLTGKLEEADHQQQTVLGDAENNKKLQEEREKGFQTTVQSLEAKVTELNAVVEEQKSFINKVLKSLNKMAPASKTKKKLSEYQQAMSHYKKGRYKSAKAMLMKMYSGKKYKGGKRARIIHNLGMIAYMDKKYNDALVLYSQLYTEHGKTSYAPNGLLFLAKSFVALDKKAEAKQTLEQLIGDYPKSKKIGEAKKMLKKL
jgi:TolA-binding protein